MIEQHDAESGYSAIVGERIRTIRRQKRLSLQDVEARSEAEFKASVLGAYERGERSISVPRLHRLSMFYNVPVEQLLPLESSADPGDQSAAAEPPPWVPGQKVVIDLTRQAESTGSESEMIGRYLSIIQVKRQDFNGRVLTIRGDDLQALAAILGTTVEGAAPRLAEMGLLYRPPAD